MANHTLHNLPPSQVSQFAQNHDTSLRACLAEILAVPVPVGVVAEVAQVLFRDGGLGLRNAMRLAPRPIGHPGQMVCPRCMPEHHKFARSFSRNWRDHDPEPSVCENPRTQPRCWQAKAWRCRIGPDLRCLSSVLRSQLIWRWESGSTVGNFTHLLLATPCVQHAYICRRCPRITKR